MPPMIAVIVAFAIIACIAAVIGLSIAVWRDRRNEVRLSVIGVTEDRRSAQQLGALRAAFQAKSDAEFQRHVDDLVAINRHRRTLKRGRLALIMSDEPIELADAFRRQAL